jgi:chromosome segregation ATPase
VPRQQQLQMMVRESEVPLQ